MPQCRLLPSRSKDWAAQVREESKPFLVKWQDGKLEAVDWEDNKQLTMQRRALGPGDKIVVARGALEKFGWYDASCPTGVLSPSDAFSGEVIRQLIVIDEQVGESS